MIKFKYDIDKQRFDDLFFWVKEVVKNGYFWASERGLPYVVTQTWTTLEDDEKVGRKTSSHREKRAIDISTKGWTGKDISEFMEYLNENFGHHGAVSASDGIRRLVVHHKGTAWHFHIQIDRKYFLERKSAEM